MAKEPMKAAAPTKVSQKTIDAIKAMGMTKAIAKAAKGGGAEFQEAAKRMYGAKRISAAVAANANPAKKTAKAYGPNNAPAYRPGGATTKKNPSTSAKTGAYGKNNAPKYTPASAAAVKAVTKKKK